MRLADERLEVEGQLAAEGGPRARVAPPAGVPVEGMQALDAWQAEGRADGELRLGLTLGEPETLDLAVETQASFPLLEYRPLGLTFRDLSGPLAWRQQGDEGGLSGQVEGRLLGGPLRADIDTLNGGLELAGTATPDALLELGGAAAPGERLSGRFDWRGLAGRRRRRFLAPGEHAPGAGRRPAGTAGQVGGEDYARCGST